MIADPGSDPNQLHAEMEAVAGQVRDVWQMAYGHGGNIQFHDQAELIIVTGTPDEIEFVQQTLLAMKQKLQVDHNRGTRDSLKQPTNTKGP